jgi:hypothetical protein
MPHTRSIAISAAVTCFFVVGIIGSFGGLSPCASCKRALLGAAVAYLAATAVVRAVWAILIQAMVDSEMNKERIGDAES